MKQIKTALFVDFDNIFSGLYNDDPDMAIVMATNPSQWLEILKKHSLPEGDERNFLVRRVYLNPAGAFADTIWGNKSGWQNFNYYRKYLTNAGFEVVDCPPLTQYSKNAADIRIVVDVFEGLNATTRYDEYIIVSSDSDFSPLFQGLRSKDRRVTMVFGGPIAPAYRNIANFSLDMTTIIDEEKVKKQRYRAKHKVWKEAEQYINNNNAPLLLKSLHAKLQKKFGEDAIDKVDKTKWFGEGSFSGFVCLMGAESNILMNDQSVWNADKHDAPEKDTPEKTLIDEEQAKEYWDVIKGYIDNSNVPVLFKDLFARIKPEFVETTAKNNWFGVGSFSGFVRLMGAASNILYKDPYIWNADKHDTPGKAVIDEKAKKCEDVVKDNIDNSNEPVLHANLDTRLRSEFGETVDKKKRFDEGSFSGPMGSEDDTRLGSNHILDVNKHAEPETVGIPAKTRDIPAFIQQFCQLVDFPRLTSKEWEVAIKKFVEYTDKHDEFNFSESAKWIRTSLAEDGFQVGQNTLNYMIRATMYNGKLSNPDHQLSADDIRESLIKKVTDHHQIAFLDLSDDNIASLDAWLSGKETP